MAACAAQVGLACSPTKSELLVLRPPKGRLDIGPPPTLTVSIDGNPIPEVEKVRILGILLQNNGKNTATISKLTATIHQTVRLIRRIANRHRGMREHDLRRLVQAFVLSRVVYSLPYLFLSRVEEDKVNALIRQAYKAALNLPRYTSNERLLHMGVHNTLAELNEAHRSAQLERLSSTAAGRRILTRIGLNAPGYCLSQNTLPPHIHRLLTVHPLPKNMHPEHHTARRAARAEALHKHYGTRTDTVYVDAASYSSSPAFAISVVSNSLIPQVIGSVFATSSMEAEEAAIALAISSTSATHIFSDSKTAVRNFTRGRISGAASRLLARIPPLMRPIQILWVPAHAGHPGNEAAHSLARGFVSRAGQATNWGDARERMVSYHEISLHYREERLRYPPPHKSLTKLQQVTWRQLQSRIFLSPAHLALIHPGLFSPECTLCGAPKADFHHILYLCSELQPPADWQLTDLERWEAAVSSSDPAVQKQLTDWALVVAEKHQLPATARSQEPTHS